LASRLLRDLDLHHHFGTKSNSAGRALDGKSNHIPVSGDRFATPVDEMAQSLDSLQTKKNTTRVPTDPLSMQLMPEGWAIGSPKSCQFFDWRDVTAFYQNNFSFGFHTFNDLVQIIPKRIFADQVESERFLDQAISLRREHLRLFAEVAVAVETGNPYQTPTS